VAARDLLALLPCLSDRQLGDVCGLSPRTIARIRHDLAGQHTPDDVINGSAAGTPDMVSDKRIGRDGRRYPRDPVALRWEIRRLLEQDSSASLRAVAAKAGASPETVRSVRREIGPPTAGRPEVAEGLIQPAAGGSNWTEDSACSSTPGGREFAQWFDEHHLDEGLMSTMAGAVPVNRLYNAIDEANRRKRFWDTFAKALQGRVCPGNTANP
jgi:AraC family transcriptional regulator